MSGGRRDRSRSPMKVDNIGRRRESKNQDMSKTDMSNAMNQMMMTNMNMYPHGSMNSMNNMIMASNLYANMMMPGGMMSGGIMPSSSMDMMSTGTGMELMPPATMDMTAMAGSHSVAPTSATSMDMNMMNSMMMDPSMISMYTNINSEIADVEKKEIVMKHCKLTPPTLGTPLPPHREKPPGCRTIFVGGLPDKIRESTVRDIFELYGRIHTLRLSKKNFCHIRFDRESSVDAAMGLSGYRIKLISKDKDEKEDDDDSHATSGWLHVDYALSRDDQNEFERRQRQALRAQQAQMQELNEEVVTRHVTASSSRRSRSPTRIQPFSNSSITQIAERIKSEDQFAATLPTLISWLERGECSKKNSNQFYSMIQATNSHIRRLFNEKIQAEDELQECKERIKLRIQKVIEQLEQVGRVFIAATHQRVWDHFTKPQRKNIETWHKMTQEFNLIKEEFMEKFDNEDNEFNNDFQNNRVMDVNNEIHELKRENESLQFQLEAYKNEVDVIKSDAQKEMEKFKAQFIARQALQGAIEKNPPLPSPVAKPPPPPPLPDDLDAKVHLREAVEAGCGEAKLIGIISAFLQVHPKGASLDYVVSYVRSLIPNVSQATIHHVLQKHPDVFQKSTTGVGANIENRWFFIAFNDDQPTKSEGNNANNS